MQGLTSTVTKQLQQIGCLLRKYPNVKIIEHSNQLSLYRDAFGEHSWYEPISVVEHKGTLGQTGESSGHYICDVKQKGTSHWFRTDDEKEPIQIDASDVSKLAYAVLFRRIDH